MIIDTLARAHLYAALHEGISRAFHYLQHTDLKALPVGKHLIDGDKLFAIVQEYDTMDAANEKMESHRRYIDVQYVITGRELVGHCMLAGQQISKEYSEEEDYMLYADAPEFFTRFDEGTFMVFFPTDPHMPCISTGAAGRVKKIVVKVSVS